MTLRPILTERLIIREATLQDAPFVLRLLNEPSWLRFIGDRGVKTLGDAEKYIAERFIALYRKFGFGFYVVERRDAPGAIGISGLVKRDTLDDVDLGFAFLPEAWGAGYAYESAAAVVDRAQTRLQLKRLVAISAVGNESAGRLLNKLGFEFERLIQVTPGADEVRLFVRDPV